MRTLETGIWILLLAACGLADTYIRQPAVDVIHYDISLALGDTSDSISGTAKIRVLIRKDGVSRMWLDFAEMAVDSLRIQGIESPFVYGEGRLSFSLGRTYSKNESATIEVRYHGTEENHGILTRKNRYGRKVVFTDSWPDRARDWFPSIDHPSDKASATITVTAPARFDVVSNGTMVYTRMLPDGRRVTQWNEENSIPTYSVAFAIAEFSILRQPDPGQVRLSLYSYPQDAQTAAQRFARTAQALSYFSERIGAYPYRKLAQVESEIRMAGMENASAIFYSESFFRGNSVSDSVVPHEIAHQWFGDSVTEADWDHLWLSEGFATYLSALFFEHLYGAQALKQKMTQYAEILRNYPPAQSAPVVNPAQTDLMGKLNPLNYEKGAWILHMLRGMLGDSRFFECLRRYYRMHKGGSVLSEDFQKAAETVSGIPLGSFFRQWLYQPGWPQYRVRWRWDEAAHEAELLVTQTQATGTFDMPVEFAFFSGNRREVHKIRIVDKINRLRIPLKITPSSVDVDPDLWILKSIEIAPY